MLIDDFKIKYKTIPFATTCRNYLKGSSKNNIETLSHMHREIEILLVLRGEARVNLNGETYEIGKGDIVIVPPFLLHNYIIFADRDFCHNCMCFDLSLLYDESFKTDIEKGGLMPPCVFKNEKCFHFAKTAYEINEKQRNGWEMQVIGNIFLFFGTLLQENLMSKGENDSDNNFCRQVLEIISVNYSANITSSDVAEELHMNNSYLCRLFKKHFGCTFQNYLCMYRLEKAKLYLKNSELTVSQIAFNTGFNSFSYFSKVFKEYYGLTPKEYKSKF